MDLTPATIAARAVWRRRASRERVFVLSVVLPMLLSRGLFTAFGFSDEIAFGAVTLAYLLGLVGAVWSLGARGLVLLAVAPGKYVLIALVLYVATTHGPVVRQFPVVRGPFGVPRCQIERNSGLLTCEIREPSSCSPEYNEQAPWIELTLGSLVRARHAVAGSVPGEYTGPWLTEAEALAAARMSTPFESDRRDELFPEALGFGMDPMPPHEGDTLRVTRLKGAILLVWDGGRRVTLYPESFPRQVESWEGLTIDRAE